jgi:acyl-CoA synthetase (AMP-forming)/AMP-acid ligase II
VAVLLPGCLEYHLALWGGEAAAIVQPLNPLLSDEKLVSLMRTADAKALIAYGSDAESGIWSKAMRIRAELPSLKTVLRVAPHDEPAARGRAAARRARLRSRRRASPTIAWSAGARSRRRTSPPTSTPAARPARPSWPGTATARSVHRLGQRDAERPVEHGCP